MDWLASAGTGVVAGVALNLVYRRIQSKWPESYFTLSDYWSHLKAQVPSRYLLFRFGPVVVLSLFFSRQLAAMEWPAWPFIAAALVVHIWPTSLRAAWRLVRYRSAGERSTPLVVLHLMSAAAVGLCLVGAALLRQHLSALVPDVEAVRDGLWTGLVASLLAVGFTHWTRAPERTLSGVVRAQRERVGPELVWHARSLAQDDGLDADLVEAVILAESMQRPRWFRRLERVKGIVLPRGTYGIMQVRAPRPIGDRRSIERALEVHRAVFAVPPERDPESLSESVVERLRGYNGSWQFLDLASEIYLEITEHGRG